MMTESMFRVREISLRQQQERLLRVEPPRAEYLAFKDAFPALFEIAGAASVFDIESWNGWKLIVQSGPNAVVRFRFDRGGSNPVVSVYPDHITAALTDPDFLVRGQKLPFRSNGERKMRLVPRDYDDIAEAILAWIETMTDRALYEAATARASTG